VLSNSTQYTAIYNVLNTLIFLCTVYCGQVWHFSIPPFSSSSPKHIEMRRKRATPSPPGQCCAHPVPGVAETNATPHVASMKLHTALPLPPNPMLDASPCPPIQCWTLPPARSNVVGMAWDGPYQNSGCATPSQHWTGGQGVVFLVCFCGNNSFYSIHAAHAARTPILIY
jgi:hypothetical protein